MNEIDLSTRLSSVIYPVLIVPGALWGATGDVGTGLAALLLGVVGAISLPRWRGARQRR